jgi:hypothetical protein
MFKIVQRKAETLGAYREELGDSSRIDQLFMLWITFQDYCHISSKNVNPMSHG